MLPANRVKKMNLNRAKLLAEWMERGDSDQVPIMMGDFDGTSTAASYYGVSPDNVTPEMVCKCADELGIQLCIILGGLTPFEAVEFMDDIEMDTRRETDNVGITRRFTTIRTPKGELKEVFKETTSDTPAVWTKNFVTKNEDLSVFGYFIERAVETILENPDVREKVTAKMQAKAREYPGHYPMSVSIGVPTFALLCNLFTAAEAGLFFLVDHTAFMEHLFEVYEMTLPIWVECAATAGADFVLHAINGLELFSPGIYQRYFIPQARVLHDLVHAHGMRTWVHTCGRMGKLIDMGIYEPMKVDVLESLSHPPLGDVVDLATSRRKLGSDIVTRGGVNVDLFYSTDIDQLRIRVREVMKSTRGYRHMIGDTNGSFPPYPRDNILALVDEVQQSGRMLQ